MIGIFLLVKERMFDIVKISFHYKQHGDFIKKRSNK